MESVLKEAYEAGARKALEKHAGIENPNTWGSVARALGLGAAGAGVGSLAALAMMPEPKGHFFGVFPSTAAEHQLAFRKALGTGAVAGGLLGGGVGAAYPALKKLLSKKTLADTAGILT